MQIARVRNARIAVERLEGAAGSLSDAFTTGRDPSFSGYRNDTRAWAAYGLFFFPRAYARTRLAVRECLENKRFEKSPDVLRICDIGAGTGAAGLAALHECAIRFPECALQLELVDLSRETASLSRSIFDSGKSIWPHASISYTYADASSFQPARPADMIISSFAVNEWMEHREVSELYAWTDRMMASLVPGGLLIVLEPSLRFVVERIERLRDYVAQAGRYQIVAPCPHHAPCPMLAEKRGWCHEVREWTPPESLRWINRKLRRDVHLLKFSMLALQRQSPEPNVTPWMRLVSPVRKEKGKFTCHSCGSDGRIHAQEWLTRHLDKDEMDRSESLERGDRILVDDLTVLGDGFTERLEKPPNIHHVLHHNEKGLK